MLPGLAQGAARRTGTSGYGSERCQRSVSEQFRDRVEWASRTKQGAGYTQWRAGYTCVAGAGRVTAGAELQPAPTAHVLIGPSSAACHHEAVRRALTERRAARHARVQTRPLRGTTHKSHHGG